MSFFINDLPANAYIPTDDTYTSFFCSHPLSSFSDNTLQSHPVPPFEDYPHDILWAPRLGTVELPDEDEFIITAHPAASYYEEPYEDELEEELQGDLRPELDEIIEWFPPAFAHHFRQNQEHECGQRPSASSPYLTPPEKHCRIPSHRPTLETRISSLQSTLSSIVKWPGDAVSLVNSDGYGISSRLSPLPHVMVCAPITLYKLLPCWA